MPNSPFQADNPVNKIVAALGAKLKDQGYTKTDVSGSLMIAGHNVSASFYMGIVNKLAAKFEGRQHAALDELQMFADTTQTASAWEKPVPVRELDTMLDEAIDQVVGRRSGLDMARRGETKVEARPDPGRH